MTDGGRGLDLGAIGGATAEEKGAFRSFYNTVLGRPHPGLEYFLNNAPETMKLYRGFADAATPNNLAAVEDAQAMNLHVAPFGFVTYYALHGYTAGVRYLVHIAQQLGLSKSNILEGLAIAFIHAGPRGSETIAEALVDYPWEEPRRQPRFPEGWAADAAAFDSGLDFSTKELSAPELASLEHWYERTLGEVPAYVTFAARHNPALLKAYRHRFEHCVRELPKQTVPATLLHYNVSRAHAAGIRENVLLARGFGMTKEQTLRVLMAPLINAGMETLTTVHEVAGPIFERW